MIDCLIISRLLLLNGTVRVIKSKIWVGHLAGVVPHRPHLLADLETWVIPQSKVQMILHYLIFPQLVPLTDQELVFLHHILPLVWWTSESRNCAVKGRSASFILSSQLYTRILRHFWGTSAFFSSTRCFSIDHRSTRFLKNSVNLFLVLSSSSSLCFLAASAASSLSAYFWMNWFSLPLKMDMFFS